MFIALIGIAAIGCGSTESDSPTVKSKTVSRKERIAKFNSQQPFSLRVSGGQTPINDVSESSIETAIRNLDWADTEQLVRLECRRGTLTVRGFTNATEDWFRLRAVSLEYGENGDTVLYSSNLKGSNEVVQLLVSFYRSDKKWKNMLKWSDQSPPIPTRLLPEKVR